MKIDDCFKILELGYLSLDKLDEHYQMIASEHQNDLPYLERVQEAYEILKSGNYDIKDLNIIDINRYAIECKERRIASKPHIDGEMESIVKDAMIKEAKKYMNEEQLEYFINIVKNDSMILSSTINYDDLFYILRANAKNTDVKKIEKTIKTRDEEDISFLVEHINNIIDNQDVIDMIYNLGNKEQKNTTIKI